MIHKAKCFSHQLLRFEILVNNDTKFIQKTK